MVGTRFEAPPDRDVQAVQRSSIRQLVDVVGLYLNPPEKAIVLCADESLGASPGPNQASLPMIAGRAQTMTHDYKRHGTTTLFAALDVLTGAVIGQCLPRHRHQEFEVLRTIDREVPKNEKIHLILDNYATHKHPTVRAWLDKHPRFQATSPRPRRRGSISSNAGSAKR